LRSILTKAPSRIAIMGRLAASIITSGLTPVLRKKNMRKGYIRKNG
jgi:hypothetical protein